MFNDCMYPPKEVLELITKFQRADLDVTTLNKREVQILTDILVRYRQFITSAQ